MKNSVSMGNVITIAAVTDIASGAMVVVGARVAVAVSFIKAGETGPGQVVGGFSIAKLSTDVVAQGALLYFDNVNKRLTTTASGNTLAGFAMDAAGAGVATVNIKINA